MSELIAGNELWTWLRGRQPIISGAPDLERQVQPNGVDLTLESLLRLESSGSLGFSDDDRVLPDVSEIGFDAEGWVWLEPGCYRAAFTETVSLPLDMYALALPRSSLLRMGVSVGSAFWDAGFSGRGETLLTVSNPHGVRLRKGARIVQIAFFRMERPVPRGYQGRYQSPR